MPFSSLWYKLVREPFANNSATTVSGGHGDDDGLVFYVPFNII